MSLMTELTLALTNA